MTNARFLPYAQQHISATDIDEVAKSLRASLITRGERVAAFEQSIADYCGARFAVAFNTGTAALMASYYAADIGTADRFITTPNTFVATVGAGTQRGARPIFIDIDRKTGNLDLEQLRHNINQPNSRGKTAVVPVHFAGIPVDMETVDKLISNPETIVIEDAAHAIGSRYKDGTKVGSCRWSHITMFSFHPAKTITTGEGGMALTNDQNLYHRLQLYRNNGIEREQPFLQGQAAPWYYEVASATGNYNFTEMQGALGLSQMRRLDEFVAKRQKLMRHYYKKMNGFEKIQLLSPDENLFVAYHLCVAQIDFAHYKKTRSEVMLTLKEHNIGTQLHYIPVYRHPFFQRQCGDINDYFPNMESYYQQALSLPLFFEMEEEDVERVVDALKICLTIR
jgi:UDP-4-amino-4,6-dideoxy-N-acetyl-beta-L-altrosamine transaminase